MEDIEDIDINDLSVKHQKRMCELYIFNSDMNTNEYNMCEGSRCLGIPY